MAEQNEQELMMKFQMYEQQIRQLQQQLEAVENAIVDISSLKLGLDEIKGSEGKEILASIGKGIYAKAKLVSEELIVDVGGKNFVKKDIDSTKDLIQGQIVKLEDIKKELEGSLDGISKELTEEFMKSQASQE